MANTKSAQRDIITSRKAHLRNAAFKSQVRTAIKRVALDVEKKDLAKAEADLKLACSVIDRSYSLGIQKKNTIGRQKARVYADVNGLRAALAKTAEAAK